MITEIVFKYLRGILTGAFGGATFAAMWHILYHGGRALIIYVGLVFGLLLVLNLMFLEIIYNLKNKK